MKYWTLIPADGPPRVFCGEVLKPLTPVGVGLHRVNFLAFALDRAGRPASASKANGG